MSRITVRTDGGPCELPAGSSLASLLDQLSQTKALDTDAIATAVNGEFVPRSERARHVLQDGDTVLCFAAITGG